MKKRIAMAERERGYIVIRWPATLAIYSPAFYLVIKAVVIEGDSFWHRNKSHGKWKAFVLSPNIKSVILHYWSLGRYDRDDGCQNFSKPAWFSKISSECISLTEGGWWLNSKSKNALNELQQMVIYSLLQHKKHHHKTFAKFYVHQTQNLWTWLRSLLSIVQK